MPKSQIIQINCQYIFFKLWRNSTSNVNEIETKRNKARPKYLFLNHWRNEEKLIHLSLNYQRDEQKWIYLFLNYRKSEDKPKYLFLNYWRNKDKAKYSFLNYRRNEDEAKYSFLNYRWLDIAKQYNVWIFVFVTDQTRPKIIVKETQHHLGTRWQVQNKKLFSQDKYTSKQKAVYFQAKHSAKCTSNQNALVFQAKSCAHSNKI
jgi:hypothetical protein